jgi:hypothetical protein
MVSVDILYVIGHHAVRPIISVASVRTVSNSLVPSVFGLYKNAVLPLCCSMAQKACGVFFPNINPAKSTALIIIGIMVISSCILFYCSDDAPLSGY